MAVHSHASLFLQITTYRLLCWVGITNMEWYALECKQYTKYAVKQWLQWYGNRCGIRNRCGNAFQHFDLSYRIDIRIPRYDDREYKLNSSVEKNNEKKLFLFRSVFHSLYAEIIHIHRIVWNVLLLSLMLMFVLFKVCTV